jgi:hypothetical protein
VLIEARAINDRGQIAGVGWADGGQRGFLLTPGTLVIAPQFTDVAIYGSDVRVAFRTAQGATYALETATQANAQGWSVAVGSIPGTGGEVSVVHPGGAGQAQRYYRVAQTSR